MIDRLVFHELKAPLKPPPKIAKILLRLCRGERINCVDAIFDNDSFDPVLHSTISTLKNKEGIVIERAIERTQLTNGNITARSRYWIANDPEVLIAPLCLLVTRWGYRLPPDVTLPACKPGSEEDQLPLILE